MDMCVPTQRGRGALLRGHYTHYTEVDMLCESYALLLSVRSTIGRLAGEGG